MTPIIFAPGVDARLLASLAASSDLYHRLEAAENLTEREFGGKVAPRVAAVLHAYYAEHKRAPGSLEALWQYVLRQVEAGRLVLDQVDEVFRAAVDAEIEAPPMTDDELVALLAPELKLRARRRLLTAASEAVALGKNDEADKFATRLTEVGRIGDGHERAIFGGLESMRRIPMPVQSKLPLYIQDLDIPLAGGLEVESYTLFVAASGAGKSMSCLHSACVSSLYGYPTALVTTELSVSKQYLRMLSWYTKVPYDIVVHDRARAEAKLREMDLPTPILIDCGQEPDLEAILRAVAEAEVEHGKIRVLVIDHLDDVTEHMAAASKQDASTYMMFKRICSKLHRHAVRNNMWVITASQAKGQSSAVRKSAIAPPTKEDASESLYKIRKADYVLGLALDPATSTMLVGLGKNRNGPPAGTSFSHGLECCRISHAAADLAIASYNTRRELAAAPPVDDEFTE